MIAFEPFSVRICELEGKFAPQPKPLENGFSECGTYKVLGIIEHSPDGELWLILANDKNEIWRISNRHVRYIDPPISQTNLPKVPL